MTLHIRQVSSPTETRGFDTRQLRGAYLIDTLFVSGEICMTYTHLDRTVVGGAMPLADSLALLSNKQIGSPRFLDRRELGIFNIGGAGRYGFIWSMAGDNQDFDDMDFVKMEDLK